MNLRITKFLLLFLFLHHLATATGNDNNPFEDSLSARVQRDVQFIQQQLADSSNTNYIFYSGQSVTIQGDKLKTGDKYLHLDKVNKAYYGIGNSSEEQKINDLLKQLDNSPHNRKLIVYISSLFSYPEYATEMKHSSMQEKMIGKCINTITNKVYPQAFANKDFTTVCIIKVYGSFFNENTVLDKSDPDYYGVQFMVKHAFKVIPAATIHRSCLTDVENKIASHRNFQGLYPFVKEIFDEYIKEKCKPGYAPAAVALSNGVNVDCNLDASGLKNSIRDGKPEALMSFLEKLKLPPPSNFVASSGTAPPQITDAEKSAAKVKYEKILTECLSAQERADAIRVILKSGNVNQKHEKQILDFFKHIKNADIDPFLAELKKGTLLKDLLSKIDDDIISDRKDNYTGLLRELNSLVLHSNYYAKEMERMYEPSVLEQRIVKWGNSISHNIYAQPNVKKNAVALKSVSMGIGGKISISRELVNEIKIVYTQGNTANMPSMQMPVYITTELPVIELDPFEPVLFSYHNSLSILSDATGVGKGEMTILPAIFLEYARRKQLNDEAFTTCIVAADVITLASGVGTLPNIAGKLAYLRRALVLMEIANAAGNLAMNLSDLDQLGENFVTVVEASNNFLIATSIYEVGRKISNIRSLKGGLNHGKNLHTKNYYNDCQKFVESINGKDDLIHLYLNNHNLTPNQRKAFEEILALRDDIVKKAKKETGEDWGKLGREAPGAGKLANYNNLLKKLDEIDKINPGHKQKFIEDFENATPEVLQRLDREVGLVDSWDKLTSLNADESIRKNILALDAVQKPKGSRPNPNTYLSEKYINDHLNIFIMEGIGSRLVLKKDYQRFGIGKPDPGKTEYIALKSELDNLIIKCNGKIEEISKALGLSKEQLQGGLVRIDFKITSSKFIDIPSGNEFGTNNNWIPGGKLPSGNSEVIIKTEGMQENVDYFVNDIIF
ncbi:MAG: hypothetical protein ACK40G_14475 [Cytophagaceae bacterium]